MREKSKGGYGVEQCRCWSKSLGSAEANQLIQRDELDTDDAGSKKPSAAGM